MSPPSWPVALAVALGVTGWALLVAALSHSAWGLGGTAGSVVTTVTVLRGLWADCVTDATGVTSCVPSISLITLPGYLQGSRALAVTAAVLGTAGVALGAAGTQRRLRVTAGTLLLLAGVCAAIAAAWFGAAVTQEFFDPNHGGARPPQAPSPPRPAAASTASLGGGYGLNAYV
ncbi:claudin-15-like isoform X2 [Cuculus canorus]|uniref:claudin-15-like isoform X2 n=1 Tax=Cuculus canorus TaxID=55661 RepID=UPI0023AAC3D8|nr:claudin-15-like isoform X2 [Cuculus canorus]